jgi:hypothetical protein
VLKREHVITQWHDRQISPGCEWAGQIDEHISSVGWLGSRASARPRCQGPPITAFRHTSGIPSPSRR